MLSNTMSLIFQEIEKNQIYYFNGKTYIFNVKNMYDNNNLIKFLYIIIFLRSKM